MMMTTTTTVVVGDNCLRLHESTSPAQAGIGQDDVAYASFNAGVGSMKHPNTALLLIMNGELLYYQLLEDR